MSDAAEPAPVALWGGGAAAGLYGWSSSAAPGSRARLDVAPATGELRFEFALAGHGAWAIARCELDVALPSHFVVVLVLRGEASAAELQLKLVEPGGASVWWWRRRDFQPTRENERVVLRRSALEFAWGPRSGAYPERMGALEVAVASDRGAAGVLQIAELRIEPREPVSGPPQPRGVRASSNTPGHEPAHLLADNASGSWRPAAGDARPWLELDLGERREWGGIAVDFAGDAAPHCRVLGSSDGTQWTLLVDDAGGSGTRRWLRCEAESRLVRLELPRGADGGIERAAVVPLELAVSPARHAAARASAAPRGRFPRHLLGEQQYWTLVGGDGDLRKGLLGEDGALEVDVESFTLEPFLEADGQLLGWADVECRVSLAQGALPIPSVDWTHADLGLRITAFSDGESGASALVACYRVQNPGAQPRRLRLWLAIRPFQVTPAWQSLNQAGGVAPITSLARDGARVRVNHARDVVAVSAPDGFAAARSEHGLPAVFAARASAGERVDDPLGFVEGAFFFDLSLEPGASRLVVAAVPLFDATPAPPAGLSPREAESWGEARLERARARWRARLAVVPITLPPSAARFEATLRASLAWILVNREGPRIQPGTRCYRRSWIRDGALTAGALTEMGFAEEARAFLRWYAPHQLADGRIPCAVDRRGSDPTPEHDSHGQFIFAIVDVWRLTRDLDFLRELWPRVARAADAIATLRAERMGDDFRGGPCFGLLPESISHEGYSARPVHSYWDDFFAVRGLADAARAAQALGELADAARFAALRDAMRADLHASILATIAHHRLDVLPGSVELGDFDPTSTAIALDPCGEAARLPHPALERSFERYWQEFEARRRGEATGDAYTAYEIRNAVALLRLGLPKRALALLEFLLDDQRPRGWCQWPEVTTRDPRAPRFIGDLPHGWIASSFVLALRRLLVYEDEDDGTLVIAAGVPEEWAREAPGVRARGLATDFGPLDLTLEPAGDHDIRVRLGGACRPPGGIVLVSPFERPLREVVVDGSVSTPTNRRRIVLREMPAEVLLRSIDVPKS